MIKLSNFKQSASGTRVKKNFFEQILFLEIGTPKITFYDEGQADWCFIRSRIGSSNSHDLIKSLVRLFAGYYKAAVKCYRSTGKFTLLHLCKWRWRPKFITILRGYKGLFFLFSPREKNLLPLVYSRFSSIWFPRYYTNKRILLMLRMQVKLKRRR